MESWIFLSLIYGLLCGSADLLKKQTLKSTSVFNTLAFFNLIILVLLIIMGGDLSISIDNYWLIFAKSLCVFLGWVTGFWAIKNTPISIYSILMLSKVIFAGLLSIAILNEELTTNKIIGFCVIAIGVIICNLGKKVNKIKLKYILITLLSSMLISVSLFLDKLILIDVNHYTLQTYYTISLLIFIFIFALIFKQSITLNSIKNNYCLYSLAIVNFLADWCHFAAAENPHSSVIIMTLTRHSSIIVSVIIGTIIFKEKHLLKKIISLIFIVFGLFLTLLNF